MLEMIWLKSRSWRAWEILQTNYLANLTCFPIPIALSLFYNFTKAFERFEIFRNENIYFSKIKQTQGNVMEQTIEKRMFSFTDSAQDIPCQGAGWWSWWWWRWGVRRCRCFGQTIEMKILFQIRLSVKSVNVCHNRYSPLNPYLLSVKMAF